MKLSVHKEIWAVIVLATLTRVSSPAFVTPNDLMKCSYGERGSLTATCINANPAYFRNTPYRFDQLDETLKCVNCSLSVIESGTFDISGNQIQYLDLKESKIEKIQQKGFVGLIFLEHLNLSYNHIRSIYPGTFSGIKKVKTVDLSHNELSILSDDGFLELVQLESLDLKNNNIEAIATKAFNALKKLVKLDLSHNQIRQLNKLLFANLTSIEILNLEDNYISALKGDEFTNLTSLLELNLAHNKLTAPVMELKPNNNLRRLLLHNNFISRLDVGFLKGLHSLEELDLNANEISEVVPKTLQSLFKLRVLNLSYNKLKIFRTGTFTGLPQLETLNCSHNVIYDIEITGVFSLHNLHALDLSFNTINDLNYVGLISRLPRISYLKLENNLLPCYLEDEMATYFSEDNFKFVLYDNIVGSLKCLDEPPKKSLTMVDTLKATPEPAQASITGAEITLMVLMIVIFACLGFLFYLQFNTYRELHYKSSQRSSSASNLVSSEGIEDEFLRE
nr:leucine-rich repeat-containing protein 15-like isoform X1 [Leptinotarsa decemlineata]